MSLLSKLNAVLGAGKKLWETTEAVPVFCGDDYTAYEGVKKSKAHESNLNVNKLISGDNLQVCKYLLKEGYGGKIKLIYIDPPFFSKTDYKTEIKLNTESGKSIPVIRQKAYKDSWEHGMEEYLLMICARLYAFKDLLSEEGGIWLHLDWHSVHYVKIIMDEIFGEKNFVNEVIWNYKSGGAGKRRYSRKHDTLLFYAKSKGYYFKPQREKSYNRGFKPYRFKGVKEYKDETGWYTLVNMKDVWQIDMVGRTSAERTGYATQKPEALLKRIIESCTEKGDLCADFFGGSGTMAAAAEKMGRRWISCDIGRLAGVNSLKRMIGEHSSFLFMEDCSGDDSDSGRNMGGFAGGGELSADVSVENIPGSHVKRVVLELTGYRLGASAHIPVSHKDMLLIREVEENDWLRLIDYLAVDFDYDGRNFRPYVFAYKEGNCIDPKVEKLLKNSGSIAVKVIDIFGNRSFRII